MLENRRIDELALDAARTTTLNTVPEQEATDSAGAINPAYPLDQAERLILQARLPLAAARSEERR